MVGSFSEQSIDKEDVGGEDQQYSPNNKNNQSEQDRSEENENLPNQPILSNSSSKNSNVKSKTREGKNQQQSPYNLSANDPNPKHFSYKYAYSGNGPYDKKALSINEEDELERNYSEEDSNLLNMINKRSLRTKSIQTSERQFDYGLLLRKTSNRASVSIQNQSSLLN